MHKIIFLRRGRREEGRKGEGRKERRKKAGLRDASRDVDAKR